VTRFLLDTRVVIWWLVDDPALSDDVKALVDDQPQVFVSAATLWEVAIKQALGKLEHSGDLPEVIQRCDFQELPVRFAHAIAASRLPPLHRDPFDRMLVAQAQVEDLTIVTRDAQIRRYDVEVRDA
jgi:PIN domain nuclease of toxin-antitoxin system